MKNLSQSRRFHRGFTLIEVVVTVALITIVLAGLWGGVSFSRKTTSGSMLQSDALNCASTGFRKLDMFLADCEVVNFPVADTSSEYAIIEDQTGHRWVISLSEDRRTITVSSVDNSSSQVLFTTSQTLLTFTAIDFHSMGGKELKLTVKFSNVNGSKSKLLTIAESFEVGA